MKKLRYIFFSIILVIGSAAYVSHVSAVDENALANCCIFYYADTFDQYVPDACKSITNEQACLKFRSNSSPAGDDVKCCLYTLGVGLPSPKCREDFLNNKMPGAEAERKCANAVASWDEKFAKTLLGPVSTEANTADIQQNITGKQDTTKASNIIPVENPTNNNIIIILAGATVLLLIILSFLIGFIVAKNKKKNGIST